MLDMPKPPRDPEDHAERIWIFSFILVAAIVLIAVLIFAGPTKSEEYSEINPKLAAYCSIYARESVFIQVMHPTTSITADTDVILAMAKKEYGECLSVLPTLLPLPAELGGFEQWLADIRDLLILKTGRKPAAERPLPTTTSFERFKPTPVSATGLDDATWRAQCAAEYRTWNPDTGTVIRGNGIGEVPCPCGKEVKCVNPQGE